eukprot:3850925-Prymnesium_polylepis.1
MLLASSARLWSGGDGALHTLRSERSTTGRAVLKRASAGAHRSDGYLGARPSVKVQRFSATHSQGAAAQRASADLPPLGVTLCAVLLCILGAGAPSSPSYRRWRGPTLGGGLRACL